jgi:hypothetical protein
MVVEAASRAWEKLCHQQEWLLGNAVNTEWWCHGELVMFALFDGASAKRVRFEHDQNDQL